MLSFQIRSGPQFRHFSSKMFPFQIRSGPQFRHFSSKMLRFQIRSGPQFRNFSSKMLPFQIRSGPRIRHFSSKMFPFEIRSWQRFGIFALRFLLASRVAVSVGRSGRSAVCFFVLILNNAPALRAGKNQENCDDFCKISHKI